MNLGTNTNTVNGQKCNNKECSIRLISGSVSAFLSMVPSSRAPDKSSDRECSPEARADWTFSKLCVGTAVSLGTFLVVRNVRVAFVEQGTLWHFRFLRRAV